MSSGGWEAVIGLECHVQLMTRSKMFSGASTAYGAEPNTQACGVDVALPGTLPVPNAEAVRMAVRFGLAVGARVREVSVFARKNYFYPDLPKGYQISQYEEPIVEGGTVRVRGEDGRAFDVPLVRAHLEEDAGKSVHDAFHGSTGIDLNRAGTPLLEVVTEPALHSAADAAAYMKALHQLVVWLRICDGNLQEGSFRCDANVSVRRAGDPKLGTRAEIKNVNSFRFVEKAIEYEIERQVRELEAGRAIVQETRLYDETRHQTRSMRGKESAHDYRYFPDPDLPPLVLPEGLREAERAALPELPEARRARYESALGLSAYDAEQLTAARETADYFEAVLAALPGQAGRQLGAGRVRRRAECRRTCTCRKPGGADRARGTAEAHRRRHPVRQARQGRVRRDVGRRRRRGHRDRRPRAGPDQRRRRAGRRHRRRAGRESEAGRTVPRRRREGLHLAGRPGDEGHPRQGQSGAAERAAARAPRAPGLGSRRRAPVWCEPPRPAKGTRCSCCTSARLDHTTTDPTFVSSPFSNRNTMVT